MQIFGKVVAKSDIFSGMSANGEWERQTLVIEPFGDTPQMVPVEFFGKRRVKQLAALEVGSIVQAAFRIVGREHDGRWFATLDGLNIQRYVNDQPTAPTATNYEEYDQFT